jgi:hypothetical protein
MSSKYVRAVFVGGPLDGDTRTLAREDRYLFVLPPRLTPDDYIDGRFALTRYELARRHPAYDYRLHHKRSSEEWVYVAQLQPPTPASVVDEA